MCVCVWLCVGGGVGGGRRESVEGGGYSRNGAQVHLSNPTSEDMKPHSITSPGSPLIVQELCESRGGRPGLSVLTSVLVSVDVKQY